MDVGTGLDSRPCLVSIIFADLTSLHPYIPLHFIEMIFILVPPIVSSLKRNYSPHGPRAIFVRMRNLKLPRLFS